MAALALVVLVAWLLLVAGVGSYLRYRRTGDVPVRLRVERGSPEWWARLISSLGVVFGVAVAARRRS